MTYVDAFKYIGIIIMVVSLLVFVTKFKKGAVVSAVEEEVNLAVA